MGMIHTRSERDQAEAQAVVWKAARCGMLEHLTEETREIPEVKALMETFEDMGSQRWDDVRTLQRQLEDEGRSASQRLDPLSKLAMW